LDDENIEVITESFHQLLATPDSTSSITSISTQIYNSVEREDVRRQIIHSSPTILLDLIGST
jgi:hypothetical protein